MPSAPAEEVAGTLLSNGLNTQPGNVAVDAEGGPLPDASAPGLLASSSTESEFLSRGADNMRQTGLK